MKIEDELHAHSATVRYWTGVEPPGVLVANIALRGVVSDDMLTVSAIERAMAAVPGAGAYVVCFDKAILTGGIPVLARAWVPLAYLATQTQLEVTRHVSGWRGASMPLVFFPQQAQAARRWVALEAAAARQ